MTLDGTIEFVDPRQILSCQKNAPAWSQDRENGLWAVSSMTNRPGWKEAGAMSPSSGWIYGNDALVDYARQWGCAVTPRSLRNWRDAYADCPIAWTATSSGSGARCYPAVQVEAFKNFVLTMKDRRSDVRAENSPFKKGS